MALTMGCSKPDRDDEAVALSTKIVSEGLSDANHALERVDSAVIVIGTGAWVYPDTCPNDYYLSITVCRYLLVL